MKTRAFLLAAFAASFCGCAPYSQHNPSGVLISEMRTDERGFPATADIESQDIPTVAHKMAREILSTPEIANAKGVPRIVLLPLKNDSRLPINKEILLERIMATLNEKSSGKVLFLARERIELERERDSKQSRQFKDADFMLTGKLIGSGPRTSTGSGDYIVYSFTLIDPNTSDIVCQKSHQISKENLAPALYR